MEYTSQVEEFAYKLGLPTVVGKLLLNRSIRDEEEAQQFLYGDFSDLSSPFSFQEMERAVERIEKAIRKRKKILIFGDYDVDGITSTALLVRGIGSIGGNVSYLIPNRMSHGYGAKAEHVERIKKEGASLVITVDNGIKSSEFADALGKEGIDLIITDHHLPGGELPRAYAVLDPHIENGYVPNNLAGVGVAFKLLHGIFLKRGSESKVMPYLKMVALGTIADMVELLGENRIMVKEGLELINSSNSYGLSNLINVSGLKDKKLTSRDVAFRISPRINAAGRILDPEVALRLLLSRNEEEASSLAFKLNQLNQQRQKLEGKVLKEAESMVNEKEPVIFLYSEGWHRGVIGIVAYRLTKTYGKPSIVFSVDGDLAFGSGRSPKGISLVDALERAKEILISYGGHKTAAGLVLKRENLEILRSIISEAFSGISPQEEEEKVEGEVSFDDLPLFSEYLRLFPPYGAGNPEPKFLAREVEIIETPSPYLNGFKTYLRQGEKILPGVFWKRNFFRELKKGKKISLIFKLRCEAVNRVELVLEGRGE